MKERIAELLRVWGWRGKACLLASALAASACAGAPHASSAASATTSVASEPEIVVPAGYQLAWHDEFDGSGAPDPRNYGYELGLLRNHEAQYYTRRRSENARLENGLLIIEARKEPFDGAQYTSASLTTRGKQEFLFGRIEARAKVPAGVGTWPAIWLLGSNAAQVGWPKCGEIDVMENVGFDPDVVHQTIHTEAYNHLKGTQHTGELSIPHLSAEFHVYRLDWDSQRLEFFVDNHRVLMFENDGAHDSATWPYSAPMYLIMNLAIGGDWGGAHGIDGSVFPLSMQVDYVRYFRRKESD